jgi:tetratricopeptide (TPR) repeat protein
MHRISRCQLASSNNLGKKKLKMQDSQSLEQAKSFFLSGLEKLNGNNFASAEKDFETSLKFAPNRLSTLINLSIVLIKLNKFENAEKLINEGLLNHPKNKELLMGLVEIYEKLINHKPDYAEAYANLGNAFRELNMHEEALDVYNTAVMLNPKLEGVFLNRGNIMLDQKKYQEALADYDKAIAIKPDFASAYSNRGIALRGLKRLDDAITSYELAIKIKPDYAEAYYNRGIAQSELNYSDEALASYDKAIEINPDYIQAYSNRGNVLQDLNRLDEALASNDRAIEINPDYAEAYWNKSLIYLMIGDFYKGWDLYTRRWNVKSNVSKKFDTKIPNWDGRTDKNQIKILFWAEQGIGDEIFYFGILKNLTEIKSKITFSADIRLHTLFKRSMPGVEFIDRNNIDAECNENSFDYQAPIGDIGLMCSVNSVLKHKKPKPFFIVNKLNKTGSIINKNFNHKAICGISWKSSNQTIGSSKSLDLIELSPLLLIDGVEFVSLQYGSTKDEINFVEKKIGKKIHTVEELDIYNDIDGLVSLISDCDFIVTTSNITAHLTGSIGKKGIVLLPFSKGKIWYWHSGKGQSTWYPSLLLTSQTEMNNWAEPITKSKEWILEQLKWN